MKPAENEAPMQNEDHTLREAVQPWADFHGDLPDYDHPLRCVFESGVQYTVELLAKELGVDDWSTCDGTEEFDGDLGGTLMNIVLAAMPTDKHGDRIYPRDLRAALSATPTKEAACPADGNLLSEDGVCGFCGNAPPAYDDEISDEYLDTLQASINRGARRSSARFKLTPVAPAPIDMVLYCPACHVQHIDEASEGWGNPPHRSHLCHACGCIWRPADVATNGITSVKTCGKADTWGWDGKSLAAPIDNEALVEEVARAMRRDRFERTRRLAAFDETVPPSDIEMNDARAAVRAVLALPSIATRAQSAPVQSALVEEAIRALEDIVNPLGRLQREADATGARLSGMAYSIANDLSFVQQIARQALAKLKEGRA